jgi:hypothetical protein
MCIEMRNRYESQIVQTRVRRDPISYGVRKRNADRAQDSRNDYSNSFIVE